MRTCSIFCHSFSLLNNVRCYCAPYLEISSSLATSLEDNSTLFLELLVLKYTSHQQNQVFISRGVDSNQLSISLPVLLLMLGSSHHNLTVVCKIVHKFASVSVNNTSVCKYWKILFYPSNTVCDIMGNRILRYGCRKVTRFHVFQDRILKFSR